ncbi:MAG: S-layer homology domain-containing protein [Clostridia bacterium]|nr:S-layer homology domain-containing protein [Clostridia bacterium]
MKTKFSMFVVLCLLLTLFTGCLTGFAADMPVVEQMHSYDDVKEGHWSYPWVTYMTNHNYIHGYPAEENGGLYLYKPDQFITRGEFVTILYFMLKPQGHMAESFTDITTKHWSYPYVDKAVANGYLSGYGDGTVRPDAYITREEASSVVYRAFKIQKYTNETEFVDKNNISSWAYEAIMSLADLGIIVGYTGEEENSSYVQPKVNIKRAEVAALLANADKFYPASVNFSDEAVTYTAALGGKLAFDLFPKNTTDNLSVSIEVNPETKYTVTYTKDGTEKTATAEDFAAQVFTADELENLKVTLNFPDAKNGDKVQVKVTVTDKKDVDDAADDAVVGETTHEAEFVLPGGSAPTQGGGGTRVFTVTYIVNGTPRTEQVAAGKKPVNVPVPSSDPTKNYEWRDENNNIIIPADTVIRSNRRFTTDETIRRDRVVESLQAYQAMKDQGTAVATVSALTGDNENPAITPGATDGADWWTNDMLQVIVTNDRGYYENDTTKGKTDITVDDAGADKALKPIYDDVARYIVDNYDYFNGATITSSTKLEFVAYFRAMIKTIEAAADEAIKAYVNARKNGGNRDSAYDAFIGAATSTGQSSLTSAIADEYPAATDQRKSDLSVFAIAYVTDMVKNMAPDNTADSAKLNAGFAEIKAILEVIYPANYDFSDDGASKANDVKAAIAAEWIYQK